MQKLIPENYKATVQIQDVIAKRLETYLGCEVAVMEGIFTTPWFWMHRGNVSLANCHDETGVECLVNKLHIDDDFEKNEWIAAIYTFGSMLSSLASGHNVRLIATADDMSCTVRFHLIRKGQEWLDVDIEGYPTPVMYADYLA